MSADVCCYVSISEVEKYEECDEDLKVLENMEIYIDNLVRVPRGRSSRGPQ